MSHEQLIIALFGVVGSLLSWSLIRNITTFDKNIEKLWDKINDIEDEIHSIDSRLGVCETQIEALKDLRRK